MFKYLGHFIVGLLLTNWLYAEFILIVPEAAPISKQVGKVMRIPTHNEWPDIANSPRAVQLNSELNQTIGKILPGTTSLFGSEVTAHWQMRVRPRLAALFGSSSSYQNDIQAAFLSGDSIFVAQAKFMKFHDSYSVAGAHTVRRF